MPPRLRLRGFDTQTFTAPEIDCSTGPMCCSLSSRARARDKGLLVQGVGVEWGAVLWCWWCGKWTAADGGRGTPQGGLAGPPPTRWAQQVWARPPTPRAWPCTATQTHRRSHVPGDSPRDDGWGLVTKGKHKRRWVGERASGATLAAQPPQPPPQGILPCDPLRTVFWGVEGNAGRRGGGAFFWRGG